MTTVISIICAVIAVLYFIYTYLISNTPQNKVMRREYEDPDLQQVKQRFQKIKIPKKTPKK